MKPNYAKRIRAEEEYKRIMKLNAAKQPRADEYQKEDRISELPEPILHQILASCLPFKEATRTYCLSKTWNALIWNCSPELYFDQQAFEGTTSSKKISYEIQVQQFCDYVNQSIRRHRQSNIPIQKFKLHLIIRGACNRVPVEEVYKWLDYATSCNKLDQLVVHCDGPWGPKFTTTGQKIWPFRLPESLLSSVKSLKELELYGCEIPTSNNIDFSLKKLSLTKVEVDQQTLQGIFSSSRLLEQVCIQNCEGFNRVKLAGHKLERVYFRAGDYNRSQSMEVESPNLQEIIYGGVAAIVNSIPVCNCKNLTKVILDYAGLLTLKLLQSILSKFPALENLEFKECCFKTCEDDTVFLVRGSASRRQLEASDLFSFISSLKVQLS